MRSFGKLEHLIGGRLFNRGILSAFRSPLVDWRFIETLAPVKGRFAVAVWCLELLPSLTVFMADSRLFGFPRFSHAALGRGFDRVLHTRIYARPLQVLTWFMENCQRFTDVPIRKCRN